MKKLLLLLPAFLATFALSFANKTEEYKLANGLTVILNADDQATDVFGMVSVKAGAYDEPTDATGLAHYLEHMLFKGTEELGTTNWQEEKVYYDQIIELFEEQRLAEDQEQRDQIIQKINELSLKAAEYTINNEFSNAIQSIGGTGLNAGTSYDYTYYHNSFPAFQMERWLEIYSNRFETPVFRGFQAEMEVVFEEQNMYADNRSRVLSNMMNESIYGEDHPYGRTIGGKANHLKNPSLKSLINFYETYYVAGNMALILSGNFDVDEVKPLIEKSFGNWETKSSPKTEPYEVRKFKGKESVKVKSSAYPIGSWVFQTVPQGHADELKLEIVQAMLSNSSQTGLFDEIGLNGYVQYAGCYNDIRKYAGMFIIQSVPTFNYDTWGYNLISDCESNIFRQLKKFKSGDVEPWLFEAAKEEMRRQYIQMAESSVSKARLLNTFFQQGRSIAYADQVATEIEKITMEDVIATANKYFGKDYLNFYSMPGRTKTEIFTKPDIKPLEPALGKVSDFMSGLNDIPMGEMSPNFMDFENDIKTDKLADGVKLFYNENPKNDIFSMVIKFGVGQEKIPALGLATSVMNNAGILSLYTSNQLKQEFSKLGCIYSFVSSNDYTYVSLQGDEENLEAICLLLSKLYLLPSLDEQQLSAVIGSSLSSRSFEKTEKDIQYNALTEYIMHGEKSSYIDRIPTEEIKEFTLSSLTAKFTEATRYETSVHYVGKLSFDEVKSKLSGSLAFPSGLKPSTSPELSYYEDHDKTNIFFINNKDAKQSNISIYIKGDNTTKEILPVMSGFNSYFGGSFNGIVLQELRELRSLAYTASGGFSYPSRFNSPSVFTGYIGTQADKTTDAVTEFVSLIENMPQKPERIDNIKNNLIQTSLSAKPDFRSLSQTIEHYQLMGYTEDPNIAEVEALKNLTFDQIVEYYNKTLKGRPISIAIIGNKKEIDMESLEKISKIKTIPTSKLFEE